MPSVGNFSAPAVRSPLGQEVPWNGALLQPSPEIYPGNAPSPLGGNPFSFQPPGLEENGVTSQDRQGETCEEEGYTNQSHTDFYITPQSTADYAASGQPPEAEDVMPDIDDFSPDATAVDCSSPLLGAEPDDLTDFDTEGYSTLEKIYLFSRSRVGFHRVYIAKSLSIFLRGDGGSPCANANTIDASSQDADGRSCAAVDTITPDDAVQYVLPLLNGLAMDEGTVCFSLCSI